MKMDNWKFDCPVCKSEQSFRKKDHVFWCGGCEGMLQTEIDGELYTLGGIEGVRLAIKEDRLVVS
jgi:ribosomal protein L37AE/L43A